MTRHNELIEKIKNHEKQLVDQDAALLDYARLLREKLPADEARQQWENTLGDAAANYSFDQYSSSAAASQSKLRGADSDDKSYHD